MYLMVDLGGLEPPTSRLSGVRSNQLSYRSIYKENYLQIVILIFSSLAFMLLTLVIMNMDCKIFIKKLIVIKLRPKCISEKK